MKTGGSKLVVNDTRLEAEVAELFRKAETVDAEEDQRYGKGKRGDELPKELVFRESRLKKIPSVPAKRAG